MVCVLAEKYSPAKRTIAIVNKSNYSLLQKSLNIDDLVDPRMTTVSRIMGARPQRNDRDCLFSIRW